MPAQNHLRSEEEQLRFSDYVVPRESRLRRVVLESPYSGDVERNVRYARQCLCHSVMLGEAPIASHLLFTQPGVLDDTNALEREIGMHAGWAWIGVADALVVYQDYGISKGMAAGIERAEKLGVAVVLRTLYAKGA
jgi:hypothetical protein